MQPWRFFLQIMIISSRHFSATCCSCIFLLHENITFISELKTVHTWTLGSNVKEISSWWHLILGSSCLRILQRLFLYYMVSIRGGLQHLTGFSFSSKCLSHCPAPLCLAHCRNDNQVPTSGCHKKNCWRIRGTFPCKSYRLILQRHWQRWNVIRFSAILSLTPIHAVIEDVILFQKTSPMLWTCVGKPTFQQWILLIVLNHSLCDRIDVYCAPLFASSILGSSAFSDAKYIF